MSATLDRIIEDIDLALHENEDISARIREHVLRPTAPTVCDQDDMVAHTVAADPFDQAPVYGPCSNVCVSPLA